MKDDTPTPEPTTYRLAREEPIRIGRSWLRLCEQHWERNAHAPAALLTALVWWHHWNEDPDHNGPVHDGLTWVYMSDPDWYRHAGVSRGQASRIITKFVELGWVVTFNAPRPWSSSKRHVSWYRIVPEELAAAVEDLEDPRASARVPDEVSRASARQDPQVPRASARHSGDLSRASARVIRNEEQEKEVTGERGNASRDFEPFWKAYPTRNGGKVGKSAALAAWTRLTDAERARAMGNVGRFAAHCQRTGTYPPDASRWLQRTRRNGTNFTEWDEAEQLERTDTSPRRGRANVEDAIAAFMARGQQSEQLQLEPGR